MNSLARNLKKSPNASTKLTLDWNLKTVPITPDQPQSIEEIALGFIEIANENMCTPIKGLTQMKGFDLTQHVLSVFGGCGGQHACAIANKLGIESIGRVQMTLFWVDKQR